MIRILFLLLISFSLSAQTQPTGGYISNLNATVVFQRDSTIILSFQFVDDHMVALTSTHKQFALMLFDEKMNPADTFYLKDYTIDNGMMLRKDPQHGSIYLMNKKGMVTFFTVENEKLIAQEKTLNSKDPLVDYRSFSSKVIGLGLKKSNKMYSLFQIDTIPGVPEIFSVKYKKRAKNPYSPDFYFTRKVFLYTSADNLCVVDIPNLKVNRINNSFVSVEQKMNAIPMKFETFEIIDIMEDSFYFVAAEVQKPKSLFKYSFSTGKYEMLKIINFKVAYNFQFFNSKLYFIAKVPGKFHGVYSVSF
ncbi:MAG: hypothetical protein V2A54_01990 [Bacteroidota bacterium]